MYIGAYGYCTGGYGVGGFEIWRQWVPPHSDKIKIVTKYSRRISRMSASKISGLKIGVEQESFKIKQKKKILQSVGESYFAIFSLSNNRLAC